MIDWGVGVARARGLGTRLLGRGELLRLADAPDLDALLRALTDRGLVPATARDPLAAERALRRRRADQVAILVRHLGDHAEVLDVALLDEDRRSVIALLRGLGDDPARTLAGLVPSARLPEAILVQLAAQPSARALAGLLVALGHPLGSAALEAAHGGLAAVEGAVHHAWAARVTVAARRGDTVLRDHTRAGVDDTNALTARVALAHPAAARDLTAFVRGGRDLTEPAWRSVVEAPDVDRGLAALRRALPDDDVAEALTGPQPTSAVLRVRLRALESPCLLEPLSTAPILRFLLRLRAEALDLRAILWSVTLKVPAARTTPLLVTA